MNTTIKKNDLRRRSIHTATVALGGLVIGLASGSAVAQAASSGDVWNWMSYQTNGNSVSVVPSTTGANAVRDMGWAGSGTSSADINWSGRPSMRNGAGNAFAIDVIGRTPSSAAAKVIKAGAKALPFIGTGVALWDLCNELGFQCSKSGPEPEVTKTLEGFCYVVNGTGRPCSSTPESAMQLGCAYFGMGPGNVYTHASYGLMAVCAGGYQRGIDKTSTGATQVASTLDELENAIASQSGWPSGSRIHDALVESAQASGLKIPLERPTVTGPATSQGKTSTSSNPANGTTTTTTTNYGHTYNDNRVTTTVTTSVSTTNSNGETTTTTTTEEATQEQTECEINPKAWGCSDLDTPKDEVPKSEKQITFTQENIGLGNGSCPAPIPFHTSNGDYVLDLDKYCDATVTYVRPVVILFGMLAAFFIAVPGGVRL